MKRQASAFTLIELAMVISIISVLFGLGSKLWVTMERTAKRSNESMAFTAKSQVVLDRVARDIRRSVSAMQPEDALLVLSQTSLQGEGIKVTYRMEADELLRIENTGRKQERSQKIASLANEKIVISVLPDGTVRLEVVREARNRPLEVQSRRLILFARPCGGSR